jgi:hypothetical protein
MPASSATSSRRSPGTRRCLTPRGKPTSSGDMICRRARRKPPRGVRMPDSVRNRRSRRKRRLTRACATCLPHPVCRRPDRGAAAGRRRRRKPGLTCPFACAPSTVIGRQRSQPGLRRRRRSAGLAWVDGRRDGQPQLPHNPQRMFGCHPGARACTEFGSSDRPGASYPQDGPA